MKYTIEELLEKEAKYKNEVVFDAYDGVDCKLCNNRGYVSCVRDGYVFDDPCECLKQRRVNVFLKRSGLESVAETNTIDNFNIEEQWQKTFKEIAIEYLKEDWKSKWFFMGGQIGSGKTMICSAITIEILKKGVSGLYIRWQDEIKKLRALKFKDEELHEAVERLLKPQILYIDDLFKTHGKVSDDDFDITNNIINLRYASRKTTIISSELSFPKLKEIDDSFASRIFERATQKYCLSISENVIKNYRYKEK